MRIMLAVLAVLLAAIGVSVSVAYFHHELFNPRFAEFPGIARLHVILGGAYLALVPVQVLTGGRRRGLAYHRWAGRFLSAGGAILGTTALFITLVIPGGGWPEGALVGPFAVFFVVALGAGVRHVRAGRVALHREWMLRAFAIGLGIASQRILFVLFAAVLIGRKPTPEEIVVLMYVSFTSAFLLHLIVVELWIRSSRHPSQGAGATPRTRHGRTLDHAGPAAG